MHGLINTTSSFKIMSQDIVANIATSTLTVRPENLGSVPSREAFLSFPKLPVRLLDGCTQHSVVRSPGPFLGRKAAGA